MEAITYGQWRRCYHQSYCQDEPKRGCTHRIFAPRSNVRVWNTGRHKRRRRKTRVSKWIWIERFQIIPKGYPRRSNVRWITVRNYSGRTHRRSRSTRYGGRRRKRAGATIASRLCEVRRNPARIRWRARDRSSVESRLGFSERTSARTCTRGRKANGIRRLGMGGSSEINAMIEFVELVDGERLERTGTRCRIR